MAHADLPDKVMANLLEAPEADETILTRWSHCALTDSPSATLGRGFAGDLPAPEVNARTVFRMGDGTTADYLVVDRLGEGGQGIVFEAEQVYFRRRVALKMIKPALAPDPMAVKAFFREAVITSRLDHPGIIPVLDFGVSQDGRALYAMMKAGGVPWHRIIRDKTLSENLAIFDRVADIVANAHRHGILHRDIKPANVLLGNHGEVWLGDWGVALARQPDGTYSHAGPAGTPQYMAPEMARCDTASIGPASDIYLLGAVLFEIITGSPPHDGENSSTALVNSARNAIHATNQTNGLFQIAYKAMAGRPEHRFVSVDALRIAVAERLRFNESVYRQQQADTHLSGARKTGDYELFQQAIAGYEEAVALSPDNAIAKQNRSQALVEYADTALKTGEFELAASIVQAESGVDKRIVRMMQKIATEKAAVAHRRRRRIWINVILLGMVAVLFAAGTYIYINRDGAATPIDYPVKPEAPIIPEVSIASERPAAPIRQVVPERFAITESPSVSAHEGDSLGRIFTNFPQCVLNISPGNIRYDATKGKLFVDAHVSIDRETYGKFVDDLSTVLTSSYGEPRRTHSDITPGRNAGREYHSIELLKDMLNHNFENRERFIFICKSVNDSRTSSEWLIYEPGKEAVHKFQNAIKYKELFVAVMATDGRVVASKRARIFYPVQLSTFSGHPPFNATAVLPLLQDMNLSPANAGFYAVQPGAFSVTIPVEFDMSPEEAKQASSITCEVVETKSPVGFKSN